MENENFENIENTEGKNDAALKALCGIALTNIRSGYRMPWFNFSNGKMYDEVYKLACSWQHMCQTPTGLAYLGAIEREMKLTTTQYINGPISSEPIIAGYLEHLNNVAEDILNKYIAQPFKLSNALDNILTIHSISAQGGDNGIHDTGIGTIKVMNGIKAKGLDFMRPFKDDNSIEAYIEALWGENNNGLMNLAGNSNLVLSINLDPVNRNQRDHIVREINKALSDVLAKENIAFNVNKLDS